MKCRSVSIMRYGVVFTFAVLSCTTGCKGTGGWKMPSMFGSREPDASKLAGGMATPPSPADKYAPTAIASKTASGTSTTNQAAQPGSLPYGTSSTASYTATAPKGGLAAQANGYQTGPYTTNTLGTQTPSTTNSLVSGATGSESTPKYTSPYGGTYNGVGTPTTNTPNVMPTSRQLPTNNLANSATGQSFSPDSTKPNFQSQAVPTNLTAGSISAYPQNQSPAGYGNSLPTGQPSYSMPAVPNISGGLPAATAVATVPPTTQPAVSAYQSTAPAGTYAPGSTGRSTSYNFGNAAPQAMPTAPSVSAPQGLPPNTASGDNLLIR